VRSQCPGGRVDVIIGSDLIYRQSRATFEALLGTVSALCNTSGVSAALRNEQDQHQPTRVLFCTKHRMNPEDGKQHSNVYRKTRETQSKSTRRPWINGIV
jgi:hypothetical protein